VDESGADVVFEPVELVEQVLLVQAEGLGCGVDAGVGCDLLEAAQSLPAVALAFGCAAEVDGQGGVASGVDRVAGAAGRAGGDAEAAAVSADGFVAEAEFGRDVCIRAA
jgi:hypothetical protein